MLLKLDLESVDGSKNERLMELSADDCSELLTKLRAAQAVSNYGAPYVTNLLLPSYCCRLSNGHRFMLHMIVYKKCKY
jgi:hypothetical protein